MKEASITTKVTEWERSHILTMKVMKDSGNLASSMERASLPLQTMRSTKEHIMRERDKGLEGTLTETEAGTKEAGRMACKQEKESSMRATIKCKENGLTDN
jgi:hypothetical protein